MTWRRASLVGFSYLAAALAITWPLAIQLTTRLGAPDGPGDPYLNLWILGWGLDAWVTNPGAVLSGRVFDANIFHPAEGTLTYSDHFLLQALALAPLYAITGDAVLCYNVLLVGSIALSGVAMHVLARSVTGSTPGAYLAGIAWACWPYRTAHLLHIQLQALYFLPLAFWCLHRVVARRRWRDAAALGATAGLQAVASVYYGLMAAVGLVVAGVVLASATGQGRSRRLYARLLGAAVMAAALAAPTLVPYVRAQRTEGFGRTLYEASNHSASWQSYTQVSPHNLVYGRSGLLDPRAPVPGARDRRHVEHQMFPGLVVVGLALAGLAVGLRRDARPLVLSAAALVVTGGLLSFGPEGFRGLYAALHDTVYGFQAIRAPARFAVVAFLGLALLAALGLRVVTNRVRRAPAPVAVLLVALAATEYLNAALPLTPAPPRQTGVGQWLAREPTPGPVLHLPLSSDIGNTPFMVQSLEHRRPIVNGYSGQRPPFFSAIVESLAELPSAAAWSALHELDVRFVVAPQPIGGAGDPGSPLVERARFDEGIVYEVRWTPDALVAASEAAGPPPPAAGTAPFAAGETALYDVYWDGGPLNVPAGTAALHVIAGAKGAGRWEFETRVETADWVSRFFQARDRFTTIADESLLPIEHSRDVREGRRALTRTYLYDRDARHVRIGESREAARAADAVTLPLGDPHARDAITALYYLRTLPLEPGAVVRVPINEAGTIMRLDVASADRETIDRGGQRTPALRLEPRLMRRVERRQPVGMTVWLSLDARRIPLRAVVEAGFGRVRLELREVR